MSFACALRTWQHVDRFARSLRLDGHARRQLAARGNRKDESGSLVESGYLPVTVVTLHLPRQTRCAEFEAVAALLDLVENFLGRLIGYLRAAYIAKNER
jgi:hypothetical protein